MPGHYYLLMRNKMLNKGTYLRSSKSLMFEERRSRLSQIENEEFIEVGQY